VLFRSRWRGPLFETLYHVEDVTWPGVRTFYTRFGDVFAWTCALVSALAVAWGVSRRR